MPTCHGYSNGCVCRACTRRAASHNTVGIARKEVRQFIDQHLTPNGWRRLENDSSGHPLFWHPDCATDETLKLPQTPRSPNWTRWALKDARRLCPSAMPAAQRRRRRGATVTHVEPQGARVDRLMEYASGLGVSLSARQATIILARERRLRDARTFINKLVAAQRRRLRAGLVA